MNVANRIFIFLVASWTLLIAPNAFANQDLIMNFKLTLKDRRILVLRNVGDTACHELSLRSPTGAFLWDRSYCTDFDLLWFHPFFVPVKPGQYEVDLNHDGLPEVGVAVWDGGNSPRPRLAIIFTVEQKALRPYGRVKYYIESGDSLLFPRGHKRDSHH